MKSATRICCTLGAVAMTALSLAACSSSSSTTAAPSPSLVGGMTECTDAAVGAAATQAAQALSPDNTFTMENLQCSEGWAVASGILGSSTAPADGPQGAPTSFIFQAEGQFWVPQDKTKVCGSDPAATAAPADATIPADLYLAGCASG
jgi:hypothetical protein